MSDLLQWLSSSHTLTTSGWFWVAIAAFAVDWIVRLAIALVGLPGRLAHRRGRAQKAQR